MVHFSSFCLNNKKIINKILKNNQLSEINLKLNDVIKYMPNLLDFTNKKSYFYQKIERMKIRGPRIRLEISRDNILQNAFQELYHKSASEIRGKLHIQYTGEAGVDAGGLTRDFYTSLSKEMFAQKWLLFTRTNNGISYFPDYRSAIGNENHLDYFKFIGRMVAKGIFDGQLLECHFARSLYKIILGNDLTFEDL
jgi:E3 ubiquitin-protein ligase HUWE1